MTNADVEEPVDVHQHASEVARTVIAGHPQGSVRRIVLYVTTAVFAVGGYAVGGLAGLALGSVALIALLLLGFSDDLM